MPRHCASLRPTCASGILAILSIVWCSWVSSPACCVTVHSIWLLQSPGVLTGSKFLFLSLFPFLLRSHCSLAAMKDTHVVFPDLWAAVLLASPASSMSMSVSIGGFLIIPQMGLLPSSVADVTDLLAISLRSLRPVFFVHPEGMEVSFWGQFDSRSRKPVCEYRPLLQLLSCFEVSVFWPPPSLLRNPLSCVDFHAHPLVLMRLLSSNGQGMLAVSFQGQCDVQNWLLLYGSQSMSLSLTDFAVYVCQDTRHKCWLSPDWERCKVMSALSWKKESTMKLWAWNGTRG